MAENIRLVIVPRWSGTRTSDYYDWLTGELARHGVEVGFAPLLPSPDEPAILACIASLREALGTEPARLARTVLLGHSVGCQAALRFLATLAPGVSVKGGLFVAGWWSVDRPWPSIVPWMEEPFDVARTRRALGRAIVLLSDDDPFTADHVENGRLWEERVGASVVLVPGAAHFNVARAPEVLDAALKLVDEPLRS